MATCNLRYFILIHVSGHLRVWKSVIGVNRTVASVETASAGVCAFVVDCFHLG